MRKSVFIWVLLGLSMVGWAKPVRFTAQLKNGLQLVVLPDHRAPLVMVQVWYRVGSSYEPNGLTGISHALEHMMFRGTRQVGPGEYSKQIAALGGTDNAFTSYDFTAYHQFVPVAALDQALFLEADRMQNLQFDPKLFAKEMKAVLEERRMRIDDRPLALAQERFNAAAFVSNPYHHSVIGWEGDIKQYTVNDAKRWYQQWYVPNNASVVVVGDVTGPQVLALLKKHFAAIPSRPLPVIKARKAQKPMLEQRLTVQLPVPHSAISMGYQVPSLKTLPAKDHWQVYALDVLASALVSGEGGLLVENLKDKQRVVRDISAGFNGFGLHAGLFRIQAEPAVGRSLALVERKILQQLVRLQKQAMDPDRLTRIKAMVVAAHIYDQDSMRAKALDLGVLWALSLPLALTDQYVKRIQAVTAAQVRQVAQTYLVKSRRTLMQVQSKGSRRMQAQVGGG